MAGRTPLPLAVAVRSTRSHQAREGGSVQPVITGRVELHRQGRYEEKALSISLCFQELAQLEERLAKVYAGCLFRLVGPHQAHESFTPVRVRCFEAQVGQQ